MSRVYTTLKKSLNQETDGRAGKPSEKDKSAHPKSKVISLAFKVTTLEKARGQFEPMQQNPAIG